MIVISATLIYRNIHVAIHLSKYIRTNVRIYICDQYIRIFEYIRHTLPQTATDCSIEQFKTLKPISGYYYYYIYSIYIPDSTNYKSTPSGANKLQALIRMQNPFIHHLPNIGQIWSNFAASRRRGG